VERRHEGCRLKGHNALKSTLIVRGNAAPAFVGGGKKSIQTELYDCWEGGEGRSCHQWVSVIRSVIKEERKGRGGVASIYGLFEKGERERGKKGWGRK